MGCSSELERNVLKIVVSLYILRVNECVDVYQCLRVPLSGLVCECIIQRFQIEPNFKQIEQQQQKHSKLWPEKFHFSIKFNTNHFVFIGKNFWNFWAETRNSKILMEIRFVWNLSCDRQKWYVSTTTSKKKEEKS